MATKQDVTTARELVQQAYDDIPSPLTTLNLAADNWDSVPEQQQRQYAASLRDSLRDIEALVRRARRIFLK